MVRIAVCQMEIIPVNPNANFEKVAKFIEEAKKKGADLVVFPEKCDGILNKSMQEPSNTFIKRFQKLCKENKIYGVVNILVKENEQYFNRAHLVDDEGKILGKYDKQKIIPDLESSYTTPGKETVVIDTKFGRIGFAICLDITKSEIFTKYKKMGAEIIICPTLWELNTSWDTKLKDSGEDLLCAAYGVVRKICEARAIENQFFVVLCNAAGKFLHKNFWFTLYGHSSVCGPMYGIVDGLDHDKEGLLIVNINKEKIKIASQYFSL